MVHHELGGLPLLGLALENAAHHAWGAWCTAFKPFSAVLAAASRQCFGYRYVYPTGMVEPAKQTVAELALCVPTVAWRVPPSRTPGPRVWVLDVCT